MPGGLLGGVPSLTRDDPAAFAPPPAFGPFRVLHQIGVGALGPVFRTYEPTRDRLIAVKVFRLDVTPEQAQALALDLSKAAEAGLFHPSIVEPVAAGVEGTVAYRAEEYVAAESLDAAIRHYAPASLDRALPFITQLAGAIDFARAAGVGHGALHLRDIFVTPEEARASGFGVVEALERQGLRAPVRRPYSAPERIAGQPWGTPADVFSLAAIAFELLTGRRPSGTGERIGELNGENLGVHADMIRSVLARAMDDDPAHRHPSALGFASALEAAARGERVTGAMEQVGAISGMAAPFVAPEPPRPAHVGPHADEDVDILGDDEIDEAVFADGDDAGSFESLDSEAEPGVEEAAAALLLDPEVDENFDDIAAERELDEAHALVSLDDDLDETDSRARTLFDEDEDEAAEDLALDSGPDEGEPEVTPASERSQAPLAFAADDPFDDGYAEEPEDMRRGTVIEPPRRAMLPLALTGILCLLIGFAAAYAIFGRTPAAIPPDTAAPQAQTQPGDPADAARPGPERPYSEEIVTPPPVVPDAPPPDAPADPGAAAPAATSGTLAVRSTPSNAGVTVNGRWRGRTPLTLDDLDFGQYMVRVIQDGYEVAQENVRLSAGDPSGAVNVRLARSAPAQAPARPAPAPRRASPPPTYTGAIYVDSRPRGARVLVDGKPVGVTPLRLPEVTIGSHVVRLELAGHRTWTSSTRVAAGQEARVTGSLEQIR